MNTNPEQKNPETNTLDTTVETDTTDTTAQAVQPSPAAAPTNDEIRNALAGLMQQMKIMQENSKRQQTRMENQQRQNEEARRQDQETYRKEINGLRESMVQQEPPLSAIRSEHKSDAAFALDITEEAQSARTVDPLDRGRAIQFASILVDQDDQLRLPTGSVTILEDRVPLFDPEDEDMEIELWLEQFETILHDRNLTSARARALMLQRKVSPVVRKMLAYYRRSQQLDVMDYVTVRTHLIDTYGNKDTAPLMLQQLGKMRQKKQERVTQYFARFVAKADRLLQKNNSELEEMVVDCWVHGLHPVLANFVARKLPRTRTQ